MNGTKSKFLPYEVTELDELSMKTVSTELRETEESRTRGLRILCEELKKWKDIEPCLDATFLLSFLRVDKFDTSKALRRMKNFYHQMDNFADGYEKISMSYEKARCLRHVFLSPYRMKNNSFLIIANGGLDYNVYSFEERFYLERILISKLLENPINQMCGVDTVIDYTGFNLRSLREHTPWMVKWFLNLTLHSLPVRFKSFHVVNAPSLFSAVYRIASPIIPQKMKKRVFIHPNDNWKSLHAHIPADILPEKFGGKLNDNSIFNCIDYFGLEHLEEKFHKQLEYGYKKTKHRRQALKVLY